VYLVEAAFRVTNVDSLFELGITLKDVMLALEQL